MIYTPSFKTFIVQLEWIDILFLARTRYKSIRFNRFFIYAILFFSIFTITFLPDIVFAESPEITKSTTRSYNIPAGSLENALTQFSNQSGVKIFFDDAVIQGKTTQGLVGSYEIHTALDRLLSGTELQPVSHADGFTLIKLSTESALSPVVTTLPSIQITADPETSRYLATSSITATKTNTLLRDVPQSISVVTEGVIKDQSIRSISDAVRYVPGVGISEGEGNRDALVFRGNRSTGDFFVDGMRDDAQYLRDLYNIERIEVLKGANGMIFGRGGSGGVLNRVTKQAGWNPIREFSFQGGSFDLKRLTADINQPIHDQVALRVNGVFENAGSFRDGVESNRLGISPTVTIKPTNRTKVVLNMERYHDDRTADRGIPSFRDRPVDVKRSQFFGDPNRSHSNIEVLAFNSLIEHKFDFGLILRNQTNYAQFDKFYENVFAAGPAFAGRVPLGAYNNATDRQNIFNQTNLLYSLETGPIAHTLLAGIEIGQQITDNRRETGFFNNDLSSRGASFRVPLSNPITNVPITFINTEGDANNHSKVNITSFYFQDQIEFLPQLQAVAGVRYDLFEVDFQQRNAEQAHLTTKDGLLSPRIGLIFKPIEPLSIYTSFSQAFVPRAGEQLTSLTVTTDVLKPEKFTNLEVGFKWDIRPDLSLTAAAFRVDRTNVITVDPNDSSRSFLTKGQRTEGVEVGINGQLTQNWSVMGGYAYQVGEITSSQVGAPKGNVVAELPRNTFSIWSRYDFIPKFGAAVGVIYRSSLFASTDNTVVIPDFTRVDAALFGQLSKKVRAQLNIENLFDVNYFASVQNNNNILPGSPIAVRASLIANF
ncbi:TonB-dependent siderophore receptor [Nitrosomonas sp. Is37]|uniref:TonB-dependent siderophore receptor n=1 Tax=Nitrosomonas sp. Is37 TaxID=3080535 RepID=UPI00294AA9E5|nr:TonB-dependent siderophore receptor [Nitrosomonas sp. Is37]MDV6345230.1 TonB-dependent siderophore receptor [Nitrosomonas sp. Is37]